MVRGVIQRDLMDFRLGSTKLGDKLSTVHGGVLDKSHKIRRYKRKDYTAVVDFPVEIIGRDGVVRRYSFEESIRLYQRRIASADLRYADTELIQAEKDHCLSRIAQLRRSFFAHNGWPAVETVDQVEGGPEFLAAEVAAFLRRCLSPVDARPERFTFTQLDQAQHYTVYFIQPPSENQEADALVDGHFLLYVFRFDAFSVSPARESFFDLVKVLDGVRVVQRAAVESLIAFFHTHDCGLILTGSGSVVEQCKHQGLAEEDVHSWSPEEANPDGVEMGMRLLSQGQFEDALSCFEQAYMERHFRRVAYLGAAVVADQLGRDDAAETATVMGCRYFPGDPAMVYHRAVNRIRAGQFAEALGELRSIQEWPQGEEAALLLRGLCELAGGDRRVGERMVRTARQGTFRFDPHLAKGARWVLAQIWARNIMVAIAVSMVVAGVGAAALGSLAYLILVAVGLVGARLIWASWRRQLRIQLVGPVERRMRLSSSAVLISGSREPALQ